MQYVISSGLQPGAVTGDDDIRKTNNSLVYYDTAIVPMPPNELFIAYGQPFNISYVSVVLPARLVAY